MNTKLALLLNSYIKAVRENNIHTVCRMHQQIVIEMQDNNMVEEWRLDDFDDLAVADHVHSRQAVMA